MKQVVEKLNITAFTLKLQTLRQEAVTCFFFFVALSLVNCHLV